MRSITQYPKSFIATLVAVALLLAHPSFAQDDEDVRQSVARIAFLSGAASFNRGDDPDSWEEAVVNFPMTVGDRLYTGRDGRMELQAEGARIFLGPESELAALDLRDDIRQLSITIGTASFRINRLGEGEVFEVDTPNVSLTFRGAGYYRVDVDREGNTVASVFKGSALAVAAGGEVELQAGDAMQVDGLDQPRYDVVALPRGDAWDRWVDERSRRLREGVSVRYASSDIVGLEDLDREGEWQQIPDQGWVWSPPVAAAGWAPYRNGRWTWQDPWGWTWISYDPWGWAPYHYGSWVSYRDRWFWVPVPRGIANVRYAPARVVFTGDGPGSDGVVGWFPLGPRDPFVPWWGRRPSFSAPGATFVNQRFVTVVNRDAFVGGRFVDREMVRDQRVIRQAMAAPVLHGPLPFLPVAASVRFAPRGDGGPAMRPPRTFEGRAVVTRLAPPPAPPTFQSKMGLIKESGGRPVSRVSAEKLAGDGPRPRPVVNSRPAVPEGGKVLLTPKREQVETRKVRPGTVPEGRTMSKVDREPPPPGQGTRPGPDGGPPVKVDKPVDRGQPERHEAQPRPDVRPSARPEVKPEVKPEIRPDTRPVQRNVERPGEQIQPERRERLVKPELKPEVKPEIKPEVKSEGRPAPSPAPPRVETKPQPPQPPPQQPVAKPQPAPKAEKPGKPAKPEEPKKDKDKEKKDR